MSRRCYPVHPCPISHPHPNPSSCSTFGFLLLIKYDFQLRPGGSGAGGPREPYPVGELLTLLAAFTFAQPSAQGLQRCLRAWSAFVAQTTLEEGEGSAGEGA